ncbi:MAG: class I SAM-dependent methyltransferase [Tannerella sp.]|jgi:hypothetical protein|nr:class I SAM-dependent methyltransferase [Tannerella sp.]
MHLSHTLQAFIRAHEGDDLPGLLLSAARYPEVDVPFAVEQIAARRRICKKLPAWYADGRLVFPSKTAAEQCSSEQTARYKLRLLDGERHLCDLTGGLGVDAYFFAQKVERVTYVECSRTCFEAAMHNFALLQAGNIGGLPARAEEAWAGIADVDVFYLDPSRRREGTRLVALQDCEPDLTKLLPMLLSRAPKVIAKLSPMLDIRHTLTLLPGATAVHVISVRNECRELLFVWQRDAGAPEPEIHCVNETADGTEQAFRFSPAEEQRCTAPLCGQVGAYLYEPNAAILKAGACKLTAVRTGAGKLHLHSHLYTSDTLIAGFPGRAFRVTEVIPFCGKTCRTIARHIPQANVSVRNFPLTVHELRKRTRIAEGGNCYLFATTLAGDEKALIRCEKAKIGFNV